MSLIARLRSMLRRERLDRELDEELRSHLEMRAADNLAAGMCPEDARFDAQRRFGNTTLLKEDTRAIDIISWLDESARDFRHALRMLQRIPGFTAVSVLTLALGIGANTAIFSVVNTVLLRPLPYKDADRLVMVWGYNRARGFNTDQVSPLDFADWRSQNHVFENMAASTDSTYTLNGTSQPALIIAYSFSADYFRVLGVAPLLGRTFLPEEEQGGKNHVTVLSYSFWQTRFGGDRGLVGNTIHLDGAPYTVVGIMPPGFQYPAFTQLWTPLTVSSEAANDRAYRYLRVLARMKPDVTLQEAQIEMNTIASRLGLEYPNTNKDEGATNLISLRQEIAGDIRPALVVLLCAVGFVLLIACANVANLLLARGAGRQREVVVRSALGASRSRLVRQFLTESMLLGVIGGTLGLLLAFPCIRTLVTMFPPTIFNLSIPHLEKIPIDGWVLAFAAAVSVLTGVIFGLVPALQASRPGNYEALNASGRGLAGSAQGRRFRNSLVIAEVALSLILLTAAGLTLRSLFHLLQGDLGFNPEQVLTMRVLLPEYKYKTNAQRITFSDQALDQLKSLPGVNAVGTVTFLPLSGWWGVRTVSLEGLATPENQRPEATWSSITPDYLRALRIPLLKGRFFLDPDNQQGAPPVAIVSKSLARQLAPNMDLVGRRINVEGLKGAIEVVGVVGDVHQLGLMSETTSEIYLPFAQAPAPILCFVIRTASDPAKLATAAEAAIWAVDKDQSVGYIMPMDQLASESLAPQRVVAILLGLFGGLALVMTAVGTYGVISYSTSQRTREIGIRMALGARGVDVLRMTLREGLQLAAAGLAAGLAGALGLTRFLSSVLYGIKPTDPLTFALVSVLLAAVALIACYIPARRATRIDPMVALRYE